ncbi:WD repeat-containing protein 44 [Galdieria sulphuraria]|nr:WD repeat-containing protein 44 [Galdieria sulphuraria]
MEDHDSTLNVVNPQKVPSGVPWKNFFDSDGNLIVKNLDTGEKTSVKDLEKPVDPVFLRFATQEEQLSAAMTVSTFRTQEKPRISFLGKANSSLMKRTPLRDKRNVTKGVGHVKINSKKAQIEFDNLFIVQALRAHDGPIWSLKLNEKRNLLASGGQDAVLRVWLLCGQGNPEINWNQDYSQIFYNGKGTDEPKKQQRLGSEPSFSSSGTLSSSKEATEKDMENSISNREMNIQTKYPRQVLKPRPFREFMGHKLDILDVAWSKNDFILSASMDKTVRLWHPSVNEALRKFQHSDFITTVHFHPMEEAEKKVITFKDRLGLITASSISRDGKHLLVGTYKGLCKSFQLKQDDGTWTLQQVNEVEVCSRRGKNSKGSKISGISFKPHSEEFLVSSNDSRLRCYQLESFFRTLKMENTSYVVPENNGKTEQNEWSEHFMAHNCIVSCAIFAPNVVWKDRKVASNGAIGRVIITAGYSGEIRIYENIDL